MQIIETTNKEKSSIKFCDFLQQIKSKIIIVITKFIIRFSFFPTLFIACELGYLLHVPTCIKKCESSLQLYISDFLFQVFIVSL
jgi:hypothetical protein